MKDKYFKERLKEIESSGNLRRLQIITNSEKGVIVGNKEFTNLTSNDYLGIATDRHLYSEFLENLKESDLQFSASSSRLQTGNYEDHIVLEKRLAELFHSESALVFNSGYHANTGILPAVTTSRSMILADKLVHASIIDGIRLSQAKCIRFKHNDYQQLERLIQQAGEHHDRIIIVIQTGDYCHRKHFQYGRR